MTKKMPFLRDHLLQAATHNLWDEAVKCLFDHVDLIDRELLNEAALLSSQRNNAKARAMQSLITRDKERVELAINNKAFLALFHEIDPELQVIPGEEVKYDDLKIEMSIQELKLKLKNYLLSFGILPTLDLLLEITKNKGQIHALKHDFKTQQWEFSFQDEQDLTQWYQTEKQFKVQVQSLLEELTDANLLNGWEKTVSGWTAQPHQITSTNYHLLFPEAEDIYPLIKATDSQVDADKYRRLLHLAQDAYKLKDYDLALKYCRQVQQYIEPESAQLYEFLLQAFFNQQSANTIIQDALSGESALLQQLFVYVGRVKSLLRKNSANTSQQGQRKVQYALPEVPLKKLGHIVDNLSQSLQSYGAQIDFDYVLQNERDSIYLDSKQAVEHFLQVGLKICRFVEAKPTLVEILVNELAGGGKIDWIGTNEDHQLIDNYDFPAVGTFRSLFIQLEQAYSDSTPKLYALNLRNSLKKKLNLVYKQYPEVKGKLSLDQESTIFQIVSKWLHACKVAYLLFDEDKSFLELAIQDELTKADGLLDWFTFDQEGNLVERQLQGRYVQSDVGQEYEFILTAHSGEAAWNLLESRLIEKYYDRWLARTDQQYAELTAKAPLVPDMEELRPQIAQCLKRWLVAYKVSGDSSLADRAIEELIGKGILRWFDLFDEDGRGILLPIPTADLDADQFLQELVDLTHNYDLEFAVKEAVQNLYFKYIRTNYELIIPNALQADEQRELVLNAVQQSLFCYDLYPKQEFLQLPYVELVQERKFDWFRIGPEGVANTVDLDMLSVDPLELLAQLSTNGQIVSHKYRWQDITVSIAENRYRDLKARYEDEFHFLRRKNWQLHTRVPMVEIIQACVTLFRRTGHYRYLEIPDIEWVQNRGKLRWRFSLLPGLYFQHWQNHEISGFNYRREKREVEDWLQLRPLKTLPALVSGRPFQV